MMKRWIAALLAVCLLTGSCAVAEEIPQPEEAAIEMLLESGGDEEPPESEEPKETEVPQETETPAATEKSAEPEATATQEPTVPEYIEIGGYIVWYADYSVDDGVLTKYSGSEARVLVPAELGIEKIGDGAFSGNADITEVKIDDTVKEIGSKAFFGCEKLEKVSLPGSLETIGSGAFDPDIVIKAVCTGAAAEYCAANGIECKVTHEGPEVEDPAVEPTLLEPGLTAGSHCEACGAVLTAQQTIDSLIEKLVVDKNGNMSASMEVGGQLQAVPEFATAAGSSVKSWKSSKTKCAKIDSNGVITALAEGKTSITITARNGRKAVIALTVTDPYKPTGVTLDQKGTVSIEMGDTLTLTPALQPEGAKAEYAWKSSSKSVAVVEDGVVTPVGTGTATITLTAVRGGVKKTDSVKVKVTDQYKPTKVELAESGTLLLSWDDTLQLNAAMLPAEAKSALKWTSSSTRIATVDENGLVKPLKAGTATITVKTYNGKKDSVKVQVYDPSKPLKVELNESGTVTLDIDKTLTLTGNVFPETAETTLKWTSSNKKIATVADGVVTPVKEGTVTISVKTGNGKTDSVKVKVVDPYKPTKVVLAESGTVTLNVDQTLQLNAALQPETAVSELTWTSSNKKVATVTAEGLVVPADPPKEGTVTISVKTYNGKTDSVKVKVVDPYKPTKVVLTESGTVKQYILDTMYLNVSVYPEGARGDLTWSSSNKKVATVDQDGYVMPVGLGTATISVRSYNGKTDTVKVQVVDPYKPTKVILDQSGTATLYLGEELHLSAELEPYYATYLLKWSSSNAKIAAVDANGVVTPVAEGTATITVTTHNGKKDTVKVQVLDPYKPQKVYIEGEETQILAVNSTLQLSAKLEPGTAVSELEWSSSDEAVAAVDDSGLVTPQAEGTATITVETYNGKKDSVKIKVVDPSKVERLTINEPGTIHLAPGETFQLTGRIEPSTATEKITWASDGGAVADVDANGLVTAVAPGSTMIRISSERGKTDSVKVTVSPLDGLGRTTEIQFLPRREAENVLRGYGPMIEVGSNTYINLEGTLMMTTYVSEDIERIESVTALSRSFKVGGVQIGMPLDEALEQASNHHWVDMSDQVDLGDFGNDVVFAGYYDSGDGPEYDGSAWFMIIYAEGEYVDMVTSLFVDQSIGTGYVRISHCGVIYMDVGDTLTLSAKTKPSGYEHLVYWSSNSGAVTVSKGKVTANYEGVATITAERGRYTDTLTIVVGQPDTWPLLDLSEWLGDSVENFQEESGIELAQMGIYQYISRKYKLDVLTFEDQVMGLMIEDGPFTIYGIHPGSNMQDEIDILLENDWVNVTEAADKKAGRFIAYRAEGDGSITAILLESDNGKNYDCCVRSVSLEYLGY